MLQRKIAFFKLFDGTFQLFKALLKAYRGSWLCGHSPYCNFGERNALPGKFRLCSFGSRGF